ADKIADNMEQKKFVMISGPSSSGKTTFSKRLSVQLLASGIKPITISLDNYFVERDRTPRDENGDYDFELLYALDIDLFNQQLQELLEGKEVSLPTYNFETGKRVFKGNKVKLKDNNIVMMEGIHALNPALTPSLNEDEKFKIYVSALTTISLTNHNWISTIDNRLIRRMVRDYKYRANSVQDTIARWRSVRRGEDKWIFPFQENADVMFNSALIFELAVLKTYIMPLLQEVPKDSPEYTEANRIMRLLTCIKPMSNRDLPSTSLLREFLGGSSFKY
ncbi:MAG: nucleoside kinase, partial [Paludibacteraceae bacterium]|nr:nucleoside kinase [Paludibacteraceae bacterium]